MTKSKKLIFGISAGFLTALTVYFMVRLFTSDMLLSVIPGWHTTIYPPEMTRILLTILILLMSWLVYLMFRGAKKILLLLTNSLMR